LALGLASIETSLLGEFRKPAVIVENGDGARLRDEKLDKLRAALAGLY
jgi:hypothetical protein